MSMYLRSWSNWAWETTGPMSVPLLRAWPTLIDFMRSAMAATNWSWIPAVTIASTPNNGSCRVQGSSGTRKVKANDENNQDGSNNNLSWNHGVEGPTDDPEINALRQRQMRNFMATLLLAQGTPMLVAGDEFARTQHGNNNAYCQDSEIGWIIHGFQAHIRHQQTQLFEQFLVSITAPVTSA